MSRVRPLVLLPTVALLTACSDSSRSEPTGTRTPAVFITGNVQSSTATPLPYVGLSYRATPAPDSGDGAIDSYGVRGEARADSLGRFALRLGFYSIPTLDTVRLIIGDATCASYAADTIIALGQSLTGPTDTAFHLSVTLPQAHANARWATGPLCAQLIDPTPLSSPATFQVWFDSIGQQGTTWGRFRLNYVGSIGDDLGTLVLARVGDSLVGTMTHDAPWGSCSAYRLALGLHADSTLGLGRSSCPFPPNHDPARMGLAACHCGVLHGTPGVEA